MKTSELPVGSFLPKLNLAGTSSAQSPRRRRKNGENLGREEEEQLIKSLRIVQDERYDAMNYYKEHGGKMDQKGDHFDNICGTNRRLHGLDARESHGLTKDSKFDEIADWELEIDEDGKRKPRRAAVDLEQRIEWQESFDKEVRELFVNFELDDHPELRLKHLDRMHDWFNMHGQKQTRKVQRGPHYLVADRNLPMPPGSTKDITITGR